MSEDSKSLSDIKLSMPPAIGDKKLQLSDFDLQATVGTGTFGRVRVVKFKDSEITQMPCALKILQKYRVIDMKQVDHVNAEKDVLKQLSHPFIVNLFGVFQDEKRLFMLLEYVNGGELFTLLRKRETLTDDNVRFYSGQIVLAFEYLHGLSVVYRDLKPENLLITCDGNIKITDFGFAKVLEERTWTLCGTPEYLAPEIIQSKGHGLPVDWWALGVLIYEMLAGFPPFYDANPFGIYQKVLAGRVDFPSHFKTQAKDIVKRFLALNRSKRFGVSGEGVNDVKRHKFYRGIDWSQLLSGGVPPPWKPSVRSADDTSMFDDYPEGTEESAPAISEEEQSLFEGFG